MKRISSKSRSETERSPSKSPFQKRTRRTLYTSIGNIPNENINLNDHISGDFLDDDDLKQFENGVFNTDKIENPVVEEILKVDTVCNKINARRRI